MSAEIKKASYEVIDRSRAPIPLETGVRSAFRIAHNLPQIERIAVNSSAEAQLRKYNENTLTEALEYVPPFVIDIDIMLIPTRRLLSLQKGEEELTAERGTYERVSLILDGHKSYEPEAGDKDEAKSISRKITKIMHEDIPGIAAAKAFSGNRNKKEIMNRVNREARRGHLHRVQEEYVYVMPVYIRQVVHDYLAQGRSFNDIASDHPELANQMGYIRYLAELRLPKPGQKRPFGEKSDAEFRAILIKGGADLHAKSSGLGLIFNTVDEIRGYCTEKGYEEAADKSLGIIKNMSEVLPLVIGTELVEARSGSWNINHGARWEGSRMEGLIQAIPNFVFDTAWSIINHQGSIEPLSQPFDHLRYAVKRVQDSANHWNELQNTASEEKKTES